MSHYSAGTAQAESRAAAAGQHLGQTAHRGWEQTRNVLPHL